MSDMINGLNNCETTDNHMRHVSAFPLCLYSTCLVSPVYNSEVPLYISVIKYYMQLIYLVAVYKTQTQI